MPQLDPFHLAFLVRDIAEAKSFYGEVLGLAQGRSAETWVDFDFFGHQVVTHLKEGVDKENAARFTNPVDGHDVPVPHFGVVLPWEPWHQLADRLRGHGIEFIIEPHIRFEGEPGEQATMFFLDPSGNALEFKAFKDPANLFAT